MLGPLARPLADASPDAISVVGGAIGVAAALSAAVGLWPLALLAWLVNRVVDGIDGIVARFGQEAGTDAGGYLDITIDVAVYALLPLGVAIGVGSNAAWIATAVLLASFYFNTITWAYLAAVLEKRNAAQAESAELHRSTSVVMPSGLVEGAETTVLFTVLLLAPLIGPSWPVAVMAVMAALVVFGGVARLVNGLELLR